MKISKIILVLSVLGILFILGCSKNLPTSPKGGPSDDLNAENNLQAPPDNIPEVPTGEITRLLDSDLDVPAPPTDVPSNLPGINYWII